MLAFTQLLQVETMGRVQSTEYLCLGQGLLALDGQSPQSHLSDDNLLFPCPPRSRPGGGLGQTALIVWPSWRAEMSKLQSLT